MIIVKLTNFIKSEFFICSNVANFYKEIFNIYRAITYFVKPINANQAYYLTLSANPQNISLLNNCCLQLFIS